MRRPEVNPFGASIPQRVATPAILVSARDVKMERPRFLWDRYVPMSTLTLAVGIGGLGKSHLAVEMTARATRGQLAGDLRGECVNVVYATAEDSLASTMVPRLVAAGADLERVSFVRHDAEFAIPDDVDRLAEEMRGHGARLLVVDPVVAFVPLNIDAHKDQHARHALKSLSNLATDLDVAVVCVMHLNKAAEAGALFLRVSGSVGFMNAARSAVLVAADPADEQRRILAHGKANLSEPGESLSFRIEGIDVDGPDGAPIATSRLAWLGSSSASVGDLLRSDHRSDPIDAAEEWLAARVSDGPALRQVLLDESHAHGIAARTLDRAREALGLTNVLTATVPPRSWWGREEHFVEDADGRMVPRAPVREEVAELGHSEGTSAGQASYATSPPIEGATEGGATGQTRDVETEEALAMALAVEILTLTPEEAAAHLAGHLPGTPEWYAAGRRNRMIDDDLPLLAFGDTDA